MTPQKLKKYHSVFPDPEEKDRLCIRIEHGLFSGLGIAFGGIQLAEEENPDGTLPFKFDYSIIENVGISRDNFGDEFFILIGDILVDIINDQLERNNLEYKPDN